MLIGETNSLSQMSEDTHAIDTSEISSSQIVTAVQFGDIPLITGLIKKNRDYAKLTDDGGCTLLHWAAINNRRVIAEMVEKYYLNFIMLRHLLLTLW